MCLCEHRTLKVSLVALTSCVPWVWPVPRGSRLEGLVSMQQCSAVAFAGDGTTRLWLHQWVMLACIRGFLGHWEAVGTVRTGAWLEGVPGVPWKGVSCPSSFLSLSFCCLAAMR